MSGWSPQSTDRSSAAADASFGRGGGPLSRELYARLDSIRSAGGLSASATGGGPRFLGRAPSVDVGASPPPPPQQQRSLVLPDASPVVAGESDDGDDDRKLSSAGIPAATTGGAAGRERSLGATTVGALSPPGIRPSTTRLQDLASKQTPPPSSSSRSAAVRGGGNTTFLGDRSATIVAVSPVLTWKAHLQRPQQQSRGSKDAPAPWSGGDDGAADAASVLVQLGDAASPPAKFTRLPPTMAASPTIVAAGYGGSASRPQPNPRQRQGEHESAHWTPNTFGRDTTSRSTTAAASPRPRRVADDSPVAIRMSRVGSVAHERRQQQPRRAPHAPPSSTAGSDGADGGMIGEGPAVELPEWPSRRASPKQEFQRQRSGSSERLTEDSLRRLERNAAAREERRSRSQQHQQHTEDGPQRQQPQLVPPAAAAIELSITHFRSQGDARAEFARALRRRGAAPLPPSVCRTCGTRCETSLESPHATMWFCDGCGARLVNDG